MALRANFGRHLLASSKRAEHTLILRLSTWVCGVGYALIGLVTVLRADLAWAQIQKLLGKLCQNDSTRISLLDFDVSLMTHEALRARHALGRIEVSRYQLENRRHHLHSLVSWFRRISPIAWHVAMRTVHTKWGRVHAHRETEAGATARKIGSMGNNDWFPGSTRNSWRDRLTPMTAPAC